MSDEQAMASQVTHVPSFINGEHRDRLVDQLHSLREHSAVHSMKVMGKTVAVKSRPKLVFAMGLEGEYGLYKWGQQGKRCSHMF